MKVRCGVVILALFGAGLAACTGSPISPVTLAQRALEDRSSEDIATDTAIFTAANTIMAGEKTLSLSTLVYEQVLVVYGLETDRETYDTVRAEMAEIEDVKTLHWEAVYMTEAEKEAADEQILGIADTLRIQAEVEADWLDTEGIESLNFRVGVDPQGTAFLLGRAKSAEEHQKVVDVARAIDGVQRVVDYTYVISS